MDDQSHWTRWKTEEYELEVYKRAYRIVMRIIAGQHPMGVINLLTQLPTTVWYPYKGQAERIAKKIWEQLEELISQEEFPTLRRYNFEIIARDAGYDLEGKELATIIFRFNPDDVRDLALDQPYEPDESE